MGTIGNAENVASEAKSASWRGRSGRSIRRTRSSFWPPEVRERVRGTFTSYRTLSGLKALGLPIEQVRVEVRSRRGLGVWVMPHAFGCPVAHGRTLSEATAALIRMLDPEVEVVRDTAGRVLA